MFQMYKMKTAEKTLSHWFQLWELILLLWKIVSNKFPESVHNAGGSFPSSFSSHVFTENILLISSREKNTAFYYSLSAQRTSRVNCKNRKYKSLFYFCMRQQMTPICWKNDNAVGQMDSNTILIRTIIAHQGINGTAISKMLLYFVW